MIIAGQRPAEIATRFLRSVRGSQCTSSQAAPVVQAAEGEEVKRRLKIALIIIAGAVLALILLLAIEADLIGWGDW
jgi:hypothetical protein